MRQNDELPWVPRNPMSYRDQMKALRSFNIGFEMFRDSGGPVTRVKLGPRWLMPELVVTNSPQGGRDVLGRPDTFVDKTTLHREMRHVLGGNLPSNQVSDLIYHPRDEIIVISTYGHGVWALDAQRLATAR